jgi:uncharacterized protein (TIGR02147 family)
MNRKSMTEFDDFRLAFQYLKAAPWRRRSCSYAELALKMGYRSPRTLAMVFKGQRSPSRKFVFRLREPFELTPPEIHYLELLIQRDQLGEDNESMRTHLKSLKSRRTRPTKIEECDLAAFSQWYSIVLRELAVRPQSFSDLPALSARLRYKVSAAELQNQIGKLVRAGFIIQDGADRYLTATADDLTTPCDLPSEIIQGLHRQMLELAAASVSDFMISERELLSHTFVFDPSQFRADSGAIREFSRTFNRTFSDSNATEVYQLNIQFFPHTISSAVKRASS